MEFFSQSLTTIGPVDSKIICLINIDTERQMDRQTGVMKRRENLRVASHPIDSGRNLHNPSNSKEYAKIKENRRESQESEGVLKNTGKYKRKRKTPRGPDRIQKNPRESERTREITREYKKKTRESKRIQENREQYGRIRTNWREYKRIGENSGESARIQEIPRE